MEFIILSVKTKNKINVKQYKYEAPNLYNGNLKNQKELQNIKKTNKIL